MKWSFKVGRIAGIDIYVHATFLILLIWVTASEYLSSHNTQAMFGTLGFVLLLFLIIILHELGHALAARRYGIETKDITLLPIGGLARLVRIPEDPKQELFVALAGPLVNIVIAAALFVGMLLTSGTPTIRDLSFDSSFIVALIVVNVWLAFFNLLPAFPMDGGRVLRALLSLKLPRERATEISVAVGHAMALIFGAIGLFGVRPLFDSNPFLVFIAFFVWIGADAELQQEKVKEYLHGIAVREVMVSDFSKLEPTDSLEDVARRLVPGFQRDFPVLDGNRLVGFVGHDEVVRGLAESGAEASVLDYVRRDFKVVAPSDLLEDVAADWEPGDGPPIAVLVNGDLVGMVTPANVGEHLILLAARRQFPSGSKA